MKPTQSKWNPWTSEEGLTFVRALQEALAPLGFNVGLTGSVLLKGESTNDIDVIVYPHNAGKIDMGPVKAALEDFGLKLLADRIRVANVWARNGSTDTKHVEAWETEGGKKVDLFFLR